MKLQSFLLISIIFFLFSCSTQNKNIPLPEHPRPDFKRETWQNLNGYWYFKPDSADTGLEKKWNETPGIFTDKILVPFSWASPLSGIQKPKVNVGWYYRTFKLKGAEWEKKDVYLVFCASDFHTTVWINGKEVGKHSGGYVPFEFNISEYLKKGSNEVVVRVEDEELDNRPSGKQYYGNAKGIWQTVYLEARPGLYISNIRFTPDIDKSSVGVEVALNKAAENDIQFKLSGIKNELEFTAGIEKGNTGASFEIPVNNMKLWDLEHPFLYDVVAEINAGREKDEILTYFGMRKISAVKIPGKDFQYVALNNKPLYLKLTLDQSYHPKGFYTFPSDRFMREEIQRAKNLGLNGLRIHIKAEIPRKLYWADKLGLLIMEDVPNFWGEPTPEARANWEYIAQKEMERDYNHPSIFSWVLFNETWGLFTRDTVTGRRSYLPETQEWVRSWYYKAKEFDPTRLVEDNSPCNLDHVITDINTWHSYLPARHWAPYLDMVVENTYPGSPYNYIGDNRQTDVPMFNSECGAVWGYAGSTGDIDITWEYHIMMNEFRKRPKIAGFLFTEFHDVINEWNGYYRFDRSEKKFGLEELVPGMTMNDFHSDLYVVSGKDFFQDYPAGSEISIPVGISAVTGNIPRNMKLNYSVYGWNSLGDKTDYLNDEMAGVKAEPFSFTQLEPVTFNAPEESMVMIFATFLLDEKGDTLQRNFVPFTVSGGKGPGKTVVTKSPSEFAGQDWSIRHLAPQNGNKVWGMGTGYFEYEFDFPENVNKEKITGIEFRAELASRYPQEKYLEEGDAERIGMTIVSEKGTIPGYGKNSYPQTDEKRHSSLVKITANNQKIGEIELPDDPADHQGILSWKNQIPGNEWGSRERKPWLLDEAGSYGYLVTVKLDELAGKKALEQGKVTIRLIVDESSETRGGLSVYGAHSGKYPLDPCIVFDFEE